MVEEKYLKEHLKSLQRYALAILLYGSSAKNERTERSDIDICVVAPGVDHNTLYREILKISVEGYDIKIFEKMPLFLKMEVINNHRIIYVRNLYELHEYFYKFIKMWKDQEYRQRLSKRDLKRFSPRMGLSDGSE